MADIDFFIRLERAKQVGDRMPSLINPFRNLLFNRLCCYVRRMAVSSRVDPAITSSMYLVTHHFAGLPVIVNRLSEWPFLIDDAKKVYKSSNCKKSVAINFIKGKDT